MVHIEIILYTVYCITFSVMCFVVLRKLYTKKLGELEQAYQKSIIELENKFDELRISQDRTFISTKHEVSKENKLYLSQMNKDISTRIKELANIVKNRKII